MIKPVLISQTETNHSYQKLPKKHIIVNKQSQAVEQVYTHEFMLTFMHPQKFGVDYPSREVILFAESEAKRAEWVRHL